MSQSIPTLVNVVDGLRAEALISGEQAARATQLEKQLAEVQPWYVRGMVAFGAWLASLLLIGFFVGITASSSEIALIIWGVVLMTGAVFLRRSSSNDFAVQCALAAALAGQALVVFNVADSITDKYEALLATSVLINSVLFFVYPDRIHRVLTVLLVMVSTGIYLYSQDFRAIVPVIGPALAVAVVYLYLNQGTILYSGRGDKLRPLLNGLMLAAFAYLLISTFYILPDFGEKELLYPRPWLSTLLLGPLFLYVGTRVIPQFIGADDLNSRNIVYAMMFVIAAAAWAAPGLLLALIITMLGAATGNRSFTGAGIGFLVIFVGAYFYGVQVTMMTKSITLIATGAVILLLRWILLSAVRKESAHA